MINLTDKTAIVTGSSRGIGKEIALKLAMHGARVVVTYIKDEEAGKNTLKKIEETGGQGLCLQLDLVDQKSIKTLFQKTFNHFGNIDILVNNAAILEQKPCENITADEWDNIFAVDCRGVFLSCQEAVTIMQKNKFGRIINMASIGGQWGGNLAVHYSAAKAAVISITRSYARIYSKYGITSNAISPGLVLTDMSQNEMNTIEGNKKLETIPMERMATVAEISHVALFLASDMSSYITGQTINVNGGMYFG